ncbi:MAG: M20 family metallopeptidase [Lachnospiraceae bacterium]|nr:M20 family metallopeptidase [Lachnospiraceae bacterium]
MIDIEEYLLQMETLVNIDCGSYNAAGINRVADKLEEWYREIGWHVIRHDLGPLTGNLLEISNRPADHYDAMFVGHMDTVFPDGTCAERPFRRDGDYIYGPGVADMKDGDLAMFQVAKNLSAQALEKLNICMCYNPDEEIGSIYSRELLDQIGARADRIFVMESAGNNGICHCFRRKGMRQYDFEFHGKAGHAGFMFERDVASAIREMGHYIVELTDLMDREKDTTVNAGVASGGIAVNVVPELAKLRVEMRFKDPAEDGRIAEKVRALTEGAPFEPGVKTVIAKQRSMPAWNQTEEGLAYIARVREIARREGIPFEDKDRGGLSDANHLSRFCPIVLDGMGPEGQFDHSPKEFSTVSSVEPCVRLLLALLEDLAISE